MNGKNEPCAATRRVSVSSVRMVAVKNVTSLTGTNQTIQSSKAENKWTKAV